ncbi:helix-turn-helix transcriptional regulator [Metabacillus sp. Hm71]|uniref:helix-turn-helix transcriptional regulator n=1 Tax=Metabacillus sp. Hm71 TaxID=3450743 RepID=UPI003F429063
MNAPREKLVKVRKERKWTQEELAEKAGISRAYLANIENGKHNPSLRVASKLSSLLNMSMNDLFL